MEPSKNSFTKEGTIGDRNPLCNTKNTHRLKTKTLLNLNTLRHRTHRMDTNHRHYRHKRRHGRRVSEWVTVAHLVHHGDHEWRPDRPLPLYTTDLGCILIRRLQIGTAHPRWRRTGSAREMTLRAKPWFNIEEDTCPDGQASAALRNVPAEERSSYRAAANHVALARRRMEYASNEPITLGSDR